VLFTSHLFIFVFMPAVFLLVSQAEKLFGRSFALLAMIGASLIFYYSNSHSQLSILLASIAFNCALNWLWFECGSMRQRHAITAFMIAGNLACLAYYKYGAFIVDQFGHASDDVKFVTIALPLGISFFTFQQIAYAADVSAGRVKQHRLLDYVFCVSFFPHLIAGPIVNYRELIPQLWLKRVFSFRPLDLTVGASVFVVGLAKKTLLADSFAGFVSPAFTAADAGQAVSMWTAWLGVLAYTFQIYFDFSGYSDMAIGLARMFGIQLPANFASPYKSTSIIEFWRRWHITLSRFLRQYLYIPLGGNRHGVVARYRNLMITMLLGGLWHGAAWNFVLWGGIHGGLLIVNHLWREVMGDWHPSRRTTQALWTLSCGALTFLGVMAAWVFFRAQSISGAANLLANMVRPSAGGASVDLTNLATHDARFLMLAAAAFVIVFFMPNTQELFCRYHVSIRPEWTPRIARPFITWRASYPWLLAVAVLGGIACFYEPEFPQFLYWGF
jgi:alginate O-acetyltransferase complex protein AlgI